MGRILLQQICEKVHDWDNPIPPKLLKCWQKWIFALPFLEKLSIPSWYWHVEVDVYEQHTFCDSSGKELGCASYLRMMKDEKCNVAFVMGKSKSYP